MVAQTIYSRYVSKAKLNTLLGSLFAAGEYQWEEKDNSTDPTVTLYIPRKLTDHELESIKPQDA